MLSPTAAALGIAVMLAHPSHLTGQTSNMLARHSSPVETSIVLARNGASTTNLPIMQENPPAGPSTTTLSGGIMQVNPPAGPSTGVGAGIMKVNPPAGPSASGVGSGIMQVSPPAGLGTPSLHVYPIMHVNPQGASPALQGGPMQDPRPKTPNDMPALKGSQT
jgi:hypothetical protein